MRRVLALAAGAAAVAALASACTKDKEPEPLKPVPSGTASAAPVAANTPADAGDGYDAAAALALLPDAGLDSRELGDLASLLAALDAPCPSVPVSIAECLTEKRACEDCAVAARYLAVGVQAGWPGKYLGMAYGARFDGGQKKDIPIDGSPTKGPDSAPITIMEFGSYVCPHCAAEAPKLDALMAAHPKDIRLVFKPVWMPDSESSVNATRAALAAGAQGKFWEMHALVFKDESKESVADLEATAQSLGLDVGRLRADVAGSAVADRMKRDHAAAVAARIESLPSLWINGHLLLPFEKLEDRIAFELSVVPGGSRKAPAGKTAPAAH
jgi:protein-disulfide isomerase